MKKTLFSLFIIILITSTSYKNNAFAESQFSDCILKGSKFSNVSLGSPLAPERLGNREKVKIGVLPFYFAEDKQVELSNDQKNDYLESAARISKLSSNKVRVEIVFLPSVNSGINLTQFKEIRINNEDAWMNKDLSKSTWGFVKRTIVNNDSQINYLGLDSIVLEGNNPDKSFSIAEAMMFFRDSINNIFGESNKDFFRSIKTNEGYIDNAVLLDNHKKVTTITHELLHNFGLTDLYGNGNNGPATTSIMAGGTDRLLNYEKAVLGWFPINQFECTSYESVSNLTAPSKVMNFNNFKQDYIFLMKISESKAYIFETYQFENRSELLVYLLEQDLRPPITMYINPKYIYFDVFDISNPLSLGNSYVTNDFEVLISNREGSKLELNLIPKSLITSDDATKLRSYAQDNRQSLVSNLEMKAKTDEAAKAAAELKAKQETAAKAEAAKKITIICSNGKVIKKVTASKPKCPIGFKKR